MPRSVSRVPVEDAAASLLDVHVADAVQIRVEEIHDPADGLKHDRIVYYSMRGRKGGPDVESAHGPAAPPRPSRNPALGSAAVDDDGPG